MFWLVCGVFVAGVFVGVLFMALLVAARDPEAEYTSLNAVESTALHTERSGLTAQGPSSRSTFAGTAP